MTVRRLEENYDGESDSKVLRETFLLYGPLFVVIWLLFCWVRRRFPRAYSVRSWQQKLKCDLARDQRGFFSWAWRLYRVTDGEILEQCGMDALCLLRVLRFGFRLSVMGIFCSIFLLPIYKTAPTAADTESISDMAVQLTIANVPSGNDRLLATVVAAYLLFGYTMHLLLQDFQWYTANRLVFLAQRLPRNYTIYVSGIPPRYRSDAALLQYFGRIFSEEKVLETHVALEIPRLERKVASREAVVVKLEHCISLQELQGITPTHCKVLLGEAVDSIEAYQKELQELNTEIRMEISRIEGIKDESQDMKNETDFQSNFYRCEGEGTRAETMGGQVDSERCHSATTEVDDAAQAKETSNLVSKALALIGVGSKGESEAVSQHTSRHCREAEEAQTSEDIDASDPVSTQSFSESAARGQNPGLADSSESVEAMPLALSAGGGRDTPDESIKAGCSSSKAGDDTNEAPEHSSQAKGSKDLVSKAVALIGLASEDGRLLDAGFVTFTRLTTTNAAIQMIHNLTPFEMDVREAPQHDRVLWDYVGMAHEAVQFGTLIAFALSAVLCVFWTVPVSFVVSLTQVESIQKWWPALEEVMETAEWLEPVLNQLSPLLLMLFSSILPIILKRIATLEGHIGASHLETSLFKKLSAFNIIQKFFVANVSGSVVGGLSQFFENPTDIVEWLAATLPPKSTFYIQLVLIATVIGLGYELLRITPCVQAWLRERLGPNLTEKEKSTTWKGIRPLADPRDFFHARVFADTILYLMVAFVYTTIAPITCYVLAFCFLVQGAGYRHQFIYIYSTSPDSGGKLWTKFVTITLVCMFFAQLTLIGYLVIKQAPTATYLMIPLIVGQVLFHLYIRQRHFRVARRLPTEDSLRLDAENDPMDCSFLKDKYRQSALMVKELHPECLLAAYREIALGNESSVASSGCPAAAKIDESCVESG